MTDAALKHLQRLDPEITRIVARARHVAGYTLKFDGSGREIWEREKLEGALYLVRRRVDHPAYAVCVLNRLTSTDLVQPLRFGASDFELEFPSTKNFIVYRTHGVIKAIWFAEEEEEAGQGYAEVRAAIEAAEREVLSIPPTPRFVSRPGGADGGGDDGILSMTEMRDALFRLLSNDKFMQTLHSQYVQAEQRRRTQPQQQMPMHPQQMMHPHYPHMHAQPPQPAQQLIPPSSPLDQAQQPPQSQHFVPGRGPLVPVGMPPGTGFVPPPYQLPPQPAWNGPMSHPQGPFQMPNQQQQQGAAAVPRPALYPAPYQNKQ